MLRESITEESVVLEIGTGIGFFALLAAKFGSARLRRGTQCLHSSWP